MKRQGNTGSHEAATGRHVAPPAPKKAKRERPKWDKKRRSRIVVAFRAVVVLVVVIAVFVGIAAEKRRYQSYCDLAYQSFEAGDYDNALSNLRRASAINETEECLRLSAECYEAQGNLEKALEYLRRLDLNDPWVQQRIASIEEKRDQLSRADMITVGGQEYAPDTNSLVLKDSGLTDADLPSVAQLYALSSLTLSGNQLSDLSALSSLGGLSMLDLSRNLISDLRPLSSLTGLRSLYLDENPIQDFSPLYALTGLTTLSIRGIELSDRQLDELSLALPNCAIHSEAASESVPDITIGGVTFKADVTDLDLSRMELTDISALSACRALRRLNLSGNQISDLSPLMDLQQLEWLNISENHVSDLRPLMAMVSLRTIYADANNIQSTVPLGALANLKELYLSANPLTDYSGLGKLTGLETLYLEDVGMEDAALEALRGLTGLRLLSIYDNPALTGEAVDSLKSSLRSCFIQHAPLVYTIEVAGVRIRRDVTELDLSSSGVTDLSNLTLLSNLETLNLRANALGNIYSLQVITSLRHLDLAFNQISDASPLASLVYLETLDVSGNQISLIKPFFSLTNLRELNLSGNPIPAEEVERLRSALPNCNIIFE